MVASSCQEARQAWRYSKEPWPVGLPWNGPGKGDPRQTLTPMFVRYTGTLPRTTPNTFDSNAQTFGSLMLSPILRRIGLIHIQSGSIPSKTGISLARRDMTTDSLVLFSVRMEPIIMRGRFVEGRAKRLQEGIVMGLQSVERKAESPQQRIMGQPIMGVECSQNTSFHSNELIHFLVRRRRGDDSFEDGTYDGGIYNDGNEDNPYAMQSWSSPPPSYDSVCRREPLWQPYYMEQYEHEIETVNELQHLGTFGMRPPYRFGTHEDDPLAREYTKLDPQVLVIASNIKAGQREGHHFLSLLHAEVVSKTTSTIFDLRDVVDIDSGRKTAPFPYYTMRSVPDTSFDESGTPGSTPSYQWYAKIEVACQNFRKALVGWRKCNEELD